MTKLSALTKQRLLKLYLNHGLKFHLLLIGINLVNLLPKNFNFFNLDLLDCFLPGRGQYGSRVPQASRYCALLTSIYFLIWNRLLWHTGVAFNSFLLESVSFFNREAKLMLPWWPHWSAGSSSTDQHPMFNERFPSRFHKHLLVRRPTRTGAWLQNYTKLYMMSIILTTAGLCIIIPLNICFVWPMFFTRRGFELIRETCVRFIVNEVTEKGIDGAAGSGYNFIYQPEFGRNLSKIYADESVPLRLPYVDLVPMNLYHSVRIVYEIIVDSLAWWSALVIYYWFFLCFTIYLCIDLSIYAGDIRCRLDSIVKKLRLSGGGASIVPHLRGHIGLLGFKSAYNYGATIQADEMARMEASLLDYFELVRFYNPFVSLAAFMNVFVWICYTFTVFVRQVKSERLSWVSNLDHGVQAEFCIIVCICTSVTLLSVVPGSIVNARARRIYISMMGVMAHDQTLMFNRKRWLALLNHFWPDNLYSFTINNYIDISWLSCLKVSSNLHREAKNRPNPRN